MPYIALRDASLIDQLKSEARLCPQCAFEVAHPLVERCPRCFTLLPRLRLGCSGCIHRSACPVPEISETAGEAGTTKGPS